MARIQLIGFLVILLEHKGNYGQSLARLKNVAMSSLHSSWVGSNAVDGNYNRNCGNGCCAATNTKTMEIDPWIEIDLGETNTFTRIVLYGRTDGQYPRQKLNGLNLYLDNELVSSISTTDQIYDFYNFELTRPYSAMRIKFVLGGEDKVLVLCEVDVFNDTNISTGKITSSSSTYSDWVSSLAVDGLIKTHTPDTCHCCAGTVEQTDPWLTVDLGDTFHVTLIQIHGRTDREYGGQSYEGLKIQLDDKDIGTVPSGRFIYYHQLFPAPERIGRHVKFILTGSNRLLVICEVVIYGERVISIDKQASISSQYSNWDANRAVDGDYRTVPSQCNCCTATKHQKDPYLRLNLGNVHRVTRIAIYGRTDGPYSGQNFEGMLVKSNNSFTREVTAQQPGEWINFITFQLSTPLTRREITVTLPGVNPQLVVCELILYGECSDGYFGAGCSGQCHCEGLTCHTITGVCPSRTCTPGYRGTTCSENCETSWYGQNCSESCGHCKDNQTCNHITGVCSECADGYYSTDPLCKTACIHGQFGYNCSSTCGNCRQDKPCDKGTGVCEECADGYTYRDRNCKTACNEGTYGTNCSQTCGNCRNNETCKTVDGYCSECMDGYTETDHTCKTPCKDGMYGRKCANVCGACRQNETCNFETGLCTDCANGYYVTNKLCNTSCLSHTYGYNCTKECGNCRDSAACDRASGVCDGCKGGYNNTDTLCETDCRSGYHGLDCKFSCGQCYGTEICHPVNGSCTRCSDGFFGTTCIERLRGEEESDSPAAGIIGVVAGLIVLSVIVAVAVVLYKRRRSPRRMQKQHSSKPDVALYANAAEHDTPTLCEPTSNQYSTVAECATASGSNGNEYYTFTNTTPGIAVHQLWNYIWTNNTNENKNECFVAEFKKLKDGLDLFPHKDALANRKKTRYRDMCPSLKRRGSRKRLKTLSEEENLLVISGLNDHSRVNLKIEREDEGDFINASYIDGYDVHRKFIASQGPIDVMVDDFWRMIWQQNSTKIVMLTNLKEASSEKAKCMQYWPVSGSLIFGRITIELVKDDARQDYSVRTLEIRQDNGSPRRIQQFHYKAWPDKDVPDSTWSLVQFWREVFKQEDIGNFPIVVHCSAGVGRTGTFIALDNLYHQAISTGSVTPFAIVDRLREQRIKMVQTSDQYVYLHAAVSDALLFGTHYIWQSQFSAYYDFMIKKDKATGTARLKLQYENMIQSLSDKTSAADINEYSAADDDACIYSNEIDQYRPMSNRYSKTLSERQNVVKLPGLGGSISYILSTHSGAAALTDTWELIGDNNVRSVITVVDHEHTNTVWSTIEDSIVEIYNPELVIEKRVKFLTTRQFLYSKRSKKGVTDRYEFTQFELQFSKNAADDNSITNLLELLNSWHPHISANQPVLIQCREGFEESALVAVLLNEKLRMTKNGGQINILESTMLATQACSTCPIQYNYYKYIHDTILHMVEKEMTGHTADEDEDGNIYQNM